MGNAQVKGEEPRVLLTEYHDLVYREMLGSYKLFKVMQCVHEREGPVVVKLFINREGAPDLKDVRQKVLQFKAAFSSNWLHPNVVPYQGIEIAARSAILVRQHFARNLYDRMHTRPFLSEVTKNWIGFQVLCSVCQAHSMGVAHGDLKTENIFVSSWNHAILSDFAWFKPLFLPEDDPSEFSFFFESNLMRRRCYLAPERFDAAPRRASSATRDRFSSELEAMDIFSLGCVLAELFLDGQTLMDLPKLLSYRAKQFDLEGKIAGIRNTAVQELIASMLSHDPSQRKPATEYLRLWCERVAPQAFCKCLFPLSVLLLHPVYQQPDMRIMLIHRNFANILWSTVGPTRISQVLSDSGFTFEASEALDAVECSDPGLNGGACVSSSAERELWCAWANYVDCKIRSADEAAVHVAVNAATQAAAQWTASAGQIAVGGSGACAGDAEACSSERSRPQGSSSSGTSQNEAIPCPRGSDDCEDPEISGRSKNTSSSTAWSPKLAHPKLREDCCDRFSKALFLRWEEGRRRYVGTGEPHPGENHVDASIYRAFLTESCSQCGDEFPGPGPETLDPCHDDDDEVLSIVCAIICSCVQHLSGPRMKMTCLDMFAQMGPFASQPSILEQLVPYTHALMTDPVAKVRAKAVDVITQILKHIKELPPSDAPLFIEYLFPQLLSAMGGMSGENVGEPVVLLAIARNIGALARHAFRFAELSVAAAQRGERVQPGANRSPVGGEIKGVAEAPVEVESFDVQSKHLREAVTKIVRALLEFLPVGLQAERAGPDGEGQGVAGFNEESLLNLAMGREIKMALLKNMCTLADVFGRDGTHNFLLPYLISFMNDPAWEVRAAFCQQAACLPRKVGQVSTEGIIWPCYEQALLDQEERVLEAALSGLSVLVSQRVLKRQNLVTVACKAAPLLVHPSDVIRSGAVKVFESLGNQMTLVDRYVFVLPVVCPFLKLEGANMESIGQKLLRPLGRKIFKRVMLHRDEELHDALLNKKPLPLRTSLTRFVGEESFDQEEAGEVNEDTEQDLKALDLIRPYVQLLLRSRSSMSSASGRSLAGPLRDDTAAILIPGALLQNVQYFMSNPHCTANRSLQALTETEGGCIIPAAVGPMAPHPLNLYSMQAFLAQALCLPPRRRNLGSLSYLDGTPYSIYVADTTRIDSSEAAAAYLRGETARGLTNSDIGGYVGPSAMRQAAAQERAWKELGDSTEPSDPSIGSVVTVGLPGVAAMAASSGERRIGAVLEPEPDIERVRTAGTQQRAPASWRPRGVLLATLYEYAHQSGVPVVKVDTTDDSRILVTGGKDGVVKIWNCPALERDVAVASSHTFTLPGSEAPQARRQQRLRTLRTIRDSKAVAIGSECGDVLLYKIEPSRGGPTAVEACRFAAHERHGACAVMCIDQFDTELESLVVFAQQHGAVQGWDVRSHSRSWSVCQVPPWLGVPSCLAMGSDGHSVTVGTLGGGLLVYDLRFLSPWKQWKVSSGAAVLSLRSADFGKSPGAFAALGGDANEVAIFDVARGSCMTLFLTEPVSDRQKDVAVSVPSLVPVQSGGSHGTNAEQLQANLLGAKRAGGCVRSLWLPPRGAQTFLLAGGEDRKVRYWSLDLEHHAAEAYIVTPHDPLSLADNARGRTTYNSNHLGDVYVVQEQSVARAESRAASKPQGLLGGTCGGSSGSGPLGADGNEASRGVATNPNHRDAILDMCTISLQHDILVTAGRDGLVKLWK